VRSYTRTDLAAALRDLGLGRGDIALVNGQWFALGRMEAASTRSDLAASIMGSIFDVIGDVGTLVVHTYSTQTARFGTPFVYERTRCINGMFPQYVLERPDALRSLHPINSFTALGHAQRDICADVSASNYGHDSPLDRMFHHDAWIVTVAMDFASNAFIHYLETIYGVPYTYNKLLDVPVIVAGRRSDRRFVANVRYLDLDVDYSLDALRHELVARGLVRTARVGAAELHAVRVRRYCATGLEMLKRDIFAFLAHAPHFVPGRIPFDGITVGRDGVTVGAFSFPDDEGERDRSKMGADLHR
jgi:aminoglycoside 3-N-acetyltransferase